MTKLSAIRCAFYLRSSKDRSDISIDAQRRELQQLAKSRSYLTVAEFVDAVESGKDDNRPGFQQLIREIKNKDRAWSVVIMLDTSRLSRNQYIAHTFKHDCAKRGVTILFSKTPELDGVTGIILPAVLHAMDEVHSFMSKEKGLAGMAENVRQGFRAGGRAPVGYRLETIATGAIRDGSPVTKSKLAPSEMAPKIAAYLKGRATGQSGTKLIVSLGLELSRNTMNGVEWNALTYAGHTVWNVHNETTKEGYVGGVKRRPREEWVIQRDTHPALITDAEAEEILAQLNRGRLKNNRTKAVHLLTGILVTPDGVAWHGNGDLYRAGKKNIKAERVDSTVITQVASDLQSPAFIKSLTESAHKSVKLTDDDAEGASIRNEIKRLDAKINRLSNLLSETTAVDTLLKKIEEFESNKASLIEQLSQIETARKQSKAMLQITEADVKAMLETMATSLPDLDRESLKDFLRGLIDHITLDASSLACCIHYKIRLSTGDFRASPRGFEPLYSP
ncbi:recombinase family protein [Nitrosovibrio tenuis]|uniref:recombinase family protein n=1 Tax=Nitrosovibrio tenuis TaxID=1233 RepID=UPI000B84B229